MFTRFVVGLLLLIAGGCATNFTGSAEVEGGRPGCEEKCLSIGLEMQAYVFMGEYSTACVCDVPGRATSSAGGSSPTAAAVGVVLQMRNSDNTEFCNGSVCASF